MSGYIDIHCHCLAQIDDGPQTDAQSLELCRSLIADGVGTVVATPHQLGRFEGTSAPARVRTATEHLNKLLAKNGLDLTVLPGGEVRLDERIAHLLADDKFNLLADNRKYLLLELPAQCFINITVLIERLRESGVRTVLAHTERFDFLMKQPSILQQWADLGVCFQITASALCGKEYMGRRAHAAAWQLLQWRLPCVVATDAHDTRGRKPMMTKAFDAISARLGQHAAQKLCIEIPAEIIQVPQANNQRENKAV